MIGLTLRLNRSEIIVAGVLSALAAAGLAGVGLAIASASLAMAQCGVPGACSDQAAALGQLLTVVPGALVASIGSASFLGATLGGLTVAAEVESGTALLAWAIAPNRRRWLLDRMAVLGGGLLLILLPWAIATWFLATSLPAGNDPMAMDAYAGAGQLIGVGAVGFATATLLGLRIGRVIPTVVGATIAAWLIALLLGWALAALRFAGAVDVGSGSGLVLAVQAIDQRGDIFTLVQAAAEAARRGLPIDQLYRIVELGVPFSGLWAVVAREALGYVAVAAALISVAFVRVTSRRPLS